MKILVCISKTPDTTSKIAFKNGNTQFDEAGVQWILNPYDEWYALVRALELKEKDPSIVLHLKDTDPALYKETNCNSNMSMFDTQMIQHACQSIHV